MFSESRNERHQRLRGRRSRKRRRDRRQLRRNRRWRRKNRRYRRERDPMLNSVLNGDWSNSVPGRKIPEGGGGNVGTILIPSWKSNFIIYLDIQIYYLHIQTITTLLCLLLVLYVLVPSIHSFFYLTITLLKSNVLWHSKAYTSHSFKPTGIGLGSLSSIEFPFYY